MSAFGGTTGGRTLPRESNGAVPVNIQDQVTEPIDAFFSQSISAFSLASPTTPSTVSSLNYDFTASGGHGIVPGDEIFLFDVPGDKAFYAIVLAVVVNTITVDRPIDGIYPAPGFNQIVTTEQAVNGSATEQIFAIQVGSSPVDITRVIISIEDDSAMDTSTFGGIAALTRGFVFRIVNSFQKTVFNFKTNGDIAQMCYDLAYASRAPAGSFGLTARITFAGPSKHGVAIRISGSDQVQWVVQDDLTGLSSLKVALQGHKITD